MNSMLVIHKLVTKVEAKESDYADIVSSSIELFSRRKSFWSPLELVPFVVTRSFVPYTHPIELWQSIQFLTFVPDQKAPFQLTFFSSYKKNIDFMGKKFFVGESSFFSLWRYMWSLMIPPWCSITSRNHHWVE